MPSPVKAAALELGLPVSSHRSTTCSSRRRRLGVVVAFGQIIKPHVLAALPMVNLHFSLLPRWRGAAPVERALLAGDDETGVCLMQLEEGLDTGPVFSRASRADRCRRPRPTSCAQSSSRSGTELLVDAAAPASGDAGAAAGRADLRGQDRRRRLRIDWSQPAARSTGWCASAAHGRRFAGKRLKVVAAELVDDCRAVDGLVGDRVAGLPARDGAAGGQGADAVR